MGRGVRSALAGLLDDHSVIASARLARRPFWLLDPASADSGTRATCTLRAALQHGWGSRRRTPADVPADGRRGARAAVRCGVRKEYCPARRVGSQRRSGNSRQTRAPPAFRPQLAPLSPLRALPLSPSSRLPSIRAPRTVHGRSRRGAVWVTRDRSCGITTTIWALRSVAARALELVQASRTLFFSRSLVLYEGTGHARMARATGARVPNCSAQISMMQCRRSHVERSVRARDARRARGATSDRPGRGAIWAASRIRKAGVDTRWRRRERGRARRLCGAEAASCQGSCVAGESERWGFECVLPRGGLAGALLELGFCFARPAAQARGSWDGARGAPLCRQRRGRRLRSDEMRRAGGFAVTNTLGVRVCTVRRGRPGTQARTSSSRAGWAAGGGRRRCRRTWHRLPVAAGGGRGRGRRREKLCWGKHR